MRAILSKQNPKKYANSPTYSDANLFSILEPRLKEHKDKVALQFFRKNSVERVTFNELLNRITRASLRFTELGFREGDRVAIVAETSPEWVVSFLAMMHLKLTAVLIDPTLPPEDIATEIKLTDVRGIIVTPYSLTKEIQNQLRDLPLILAENDRFELVDKKITPQQFRRSRDGSTKIALIILTSGTGGQYRPVMVAHDNIIFITTCKKIIDMTASSFTILPLYHIAGLTTFCQGTLYAGYTMSFVDKLEPDLIAEAFAEAKPVILLGVPRFLELFYKVINNKINEGSAVHRFIRRSLIAICGFIRSHTSLNFGPKIFRKVHEAFGGNAKLFFIGGAALKKNIQEFFEAVGFTVMLGYGLSETTGCIVLTDMDHKKMGSVGIPIPGCKIEIESPDKKGVGEVCLQSPSIMIGYFRDNEATDLAIKEGWFHTGDLGHLDSKGNLFIDGRIKELIVTAGGKKATPYEIEHHYLDIEGVSEMAVVGIPNPGLGVENVYAAIVIDPMVDDSKKIKELQQSIKEQISNRAGTLPSQFRIQYVEFFDELPKTTGVKKIIRVKIVKEIQERKKSFTRVEKTAIPTKKMGKKTEKILDSIIKITAATVLLPENEIDRKKHFAEYGIDSLMALIIVQKLREQWGETAISADELLKNPTMEEYANEIEQRLNSPQDIKEQTTSFVPPRKIPTAAQPETPLLHPLKSDVIFLTGGTGVLGGYLTKLLLTETDKTIYLLTRAATQEAAKQQSLDILKAYGASDEIIEKIDKRIHFVLGDVSKPLLGLSEIEYKTLTDKTDTVIHGAGIVSLHGLYDSLVPVNVLGTKNMIEFALKTKQKYLLYVSSYSIMGNLVLGENPAFTERDFDRGQTFYKMGYQQTKFEAELLVRHATDQGLKWSIIRPGDIFGESQQGYYPLMLPQLTGIFYDVLRTVIETKVAASTRVYFDMTPVDYVSRGIMYFAFKHPAIFGTYHLTNPTTRYYVDTIKCIQNLGYDIEIIHIEEYLKRLEANELRHKGKPYRSRTLELLRFNPTLALAKASTHVDTDITRSILESAGIKCPRIDEKLIETYIKFCKKVGYLSE